MWVRADQAAASPVKDFSSSDDVLAKRRGPDIARLQGQGTRRFLHSIRRLELRPRHPPPAPAPVVEAASRSGERSLLRSAGVVRNPGTLATEARFGVSGRRSREPRVISPHRLVAIIRTEPHLVETGPPRDATDRRAMTGIEPLRPMADTISATAMATSTTTNNHTVPTSEPVTQTVVEHAKLSTPAPFEGYDQSLPMYRWGDT